MEKTPQPDSPSSKANNNLKNNGSPTNNSKPSNGRYCHIVKRPDFDGYGFNLHSEKIKPGQYIGKVDPGSPAEAAGLREGDQIIEVNGVNIGSETHKQVVQRIKAISNEVRLLLIDPTVENVATNSKSQTKTTNKTSNSNDCNSNSPTTTPTSSSTVPMTIEATLGSEHQKDEISSISMVSMKSQSSYSNDPVVDVVDFNTNKEVINNGLHSATTTIISNGKSSESSSVKEQPTITTTTLPPPEQQSPKSIKSQNADQSQNKSGLNLNLTAAEMRAKLLAKKKFDPKNESVDLKKKFDIIQKL